MDPQSERSARLCDFIRDQTEEILAEWERAVRAQEVSAELSHVELRDRLPDLLRRVASVVASVHTGSDEPVGVLSGLHALARLDLGYDLGSLVNDYKLLRGTVLRLYSDVSGGVASIAEAKRFNDCIDDAVRVAVARYAMARGRTLLALDRISEAALGTSDLASFFGKLLQVVVETIDAVDMGAIFLWEDGALRVRASLGMLQGFDTLVLGIGEGFAGHVAAEKRPVEIREAGSHPMIKTRALPRETKALYGVPLLEDDQIIGVAYIGSRTAHDFAPEDTILLRTMASRATAFIVQARLRQAEAAERDRAQRAEEALKETAAFRERFIDVLSHDLKNLVGIITNTAALLLAREIHTERGADMAARIMRTSERMSRMIRDLLDFTRVRLGGGIPVTLAPGDLATICEQVVDEFRAGHPDRQVVLGSTGDLRGEWDADRIAQAVMNLCKNADDYGTPGTPISVSVTGSRDVVEVAVQNQGPPIPPDQMAHIFEPYRRASERRTSSGLGLGLYIVREVARAHGGTVEPHIGKDEVAFVLRLPRVAAKAGPLGSPS